MNGTYIFGPLLFYSKRKTVFLEVGGSISCYSLVFLAEEMVDFYVKLPFSLNSHFSIMIEIRRHSYDPVGFPACTSVPSLQPLPQTILATVLHTVRIHVCFRDCSFASVVSPSVIGSVGGVGRTAAL
jgi:hypothetical protein